MKTSEIDYAAVGLMVGLEVHQQLLTVRKLFCRCPAGAYTDTHDAEILRHMRPTLSELGEYDGTALMEFKTRKNIIYLLHRDNTCTYEMDDTPPFLVNQAAIDVAIEQCLMLGCDIIDEVHIARKQYLDGSIPTGFQRTAIVGVGGKIPFRGRHVGIIQVSVEEDSCREVLDDGHLVVWRTDRLGMPLIETVTEPELHTPDEVEEAILLVGRVCRSTRHVRVGPGASRQDVNVSVRGGRRVEIKGVSSARLAAKLVHGEAIRQVNLLKLRDELLSRGLGEPDRIEVTHTDVTDLFIDGEFPLLQRAKWEARVKERRWKRGFELGEGEFCVRAVKIVGAAGTLEWPTQPDHTFADELRGRIRVIAGLDQRPILFSGETWPEDLEPLMQCGPDDALLVIWGAEADTVTAAQEVRLRYLDAIDGIPHETRQPLPDGSTDFERILPGPERMYPDTDSPPTRVIRERVENLRTALPPPPWVRERRYFEAQVPRPVVYFLIRRGWSDRVDAVAAEGADLRTACFFFGEELKGWMRRGLKGEAVSTEHWIELFRAAADEPLVWERRRDLVAAMVAEPERPVAELIRQLSIGDAPPEWTDHLPDVVERVGARDPLDPLQLGLGMALETLRGHVAVAEIRETLGSMLLADAGVDP